MPPSQAQELAKERRKNLVASLLARNPRITRRQIHAALALPVSKGGIRNPQTNNPYSLGTVQGDVDEIREEWRERAEVSADQWIARTLAGYEELEIQAWRNGDLEGVRRVMQDRRKLLGLDAPSKFAPTDPSGQEPYQGNVISVYQHVSDNEAEIEG